MATTSQPKQVSVTQVSDLLEKTIVDFDHARAADLTEMNTVLNTKFAGLARDRARLATKLGASDPRVVALDNRLALYAQTTVGFASEIAASSVTPPSIDQTSWALHGNVLASSRAPISGVTVALYQNNAWINQLGFACTDVNGYFSILVKDAANVATGPFLIGVVKNGKILYMDNDPLTIQAGHVEYREIIVGDASNVCPPPDGNQQTPPSSSAPPDSTPSTTKPVSKRGTSKK
jgi:hypothetical protein